MSHKHRQAHSTDFVSVQAGISPPRPIRHMAHFPVRSYTSTELVSHLHAHRERASQVILFFANTNFVVQCQGLQHLMACEAITIVNDGIGLEMAARWLHGAGFSDNLNGTDFLPFFFRQTPQPLKVFMLGGQPHVLSKAADYVTQQLGQQVVGSCDGYDGIRNSPDLIDTINRSQADVVLVALGNPVQEKWILEHRQSLHACMLAGVGALFDFWAGNKPRAPRLIQKLRLEWCYRLCLEPRRLMRRYTIDIVTFIQYCHRNR